MPEASTAPPVDGICWSRGRSSSTGHSSGRFGRLDRRISIPLRQRLVQLEVLPGRGVPAEVAAHPFRLDPGPARRVAERADGLPDGPLHRIGTVVVEAKPGHAVLDRVDETARGAD